MSTVRTMTIEHLGSDATDNDLLEFRSICAEAQRLHPEMDDDAVTEAVFGDGDYCRNARRLGVDVDSIVTEAK